MTDEQLAKDFNISIESLRFAAWLKDNHPALFEQCGAGTITLDQAACRVVEKEAEAKA